MWFSHTDDNKFEVEMKSDLNSEIPKLIPNTEDYQRALQKFIDDILDQKVAKTDMKVRHIVTKAIEVRVVFLKYSEFQSNGNNHFYINKGCYRDYS